MGVERVSVQGSGVQGSEVEGSGLVKVNKRKATLPPAHKGPRPGGNAEPVTPEPVHAYVTGNPIGTRM